MITAASDVIQILLSADDDPWLSTAVVCIFGTNK
jgi:hypothetical protein